MATGNLLSDAAILQLSEMKQQVQLLFQNFEKLQRLRMPGIIPMRSYVALTGNPGITAASSSGGVTTPGSGTVTLQELDSSGDLSSMLDSAGAAITVTCKNFVETASAVGAFVFISQDVHGTFWLLAEACA